MNISFGQFLKKLRNEAEITQQQLAVFCDCSKQYISDIERGNNKPPDNELLEKLSECLRLNDKQKESLRDYAAQARSDIASDIKQILINNPNEIKRLRRIYAK